MNHVRWVAWGVIDPDDHEKFDRQQRRNYLNEVTKQLEDAGVEFHQGGNRCLPWYKVKVGSKDKAFGGRPALRSACVFVLTELGDVSSEDGGVRSAGAEADAGAHGRSVS